MAVVKQLYKAHALNPKLLLALALFVVLALTLAPDPNGSGKSNFTPFRNSGGPLDLWGNVGLFLPFGVLAGIIPEQKTRPAWARVLLVLGAGLLISVLIETTQFWLPTRSADIDDVICNSSGALLGAILALTFRIGPGHKIYAHGLATPRFEQQ
jgi:glycopeptide antibiotics resistance protein